MKRKFLSLILVFAMTVSLLTVGTGAVEPTYGDTAGHWAESSIERWSAYGIIQGSNGLFDPNGQLTCAQLATILAKLLKLPAAKDAGFTDNTADAWYYDAINRCAAAGILNGNGDGTVTPEAPISRERAMVMLGRALGIEPIREPDLTKYTDAAQVSAYARGYVAALIEAGIVGGVTADELAPQDNINRASTVTILDRAISTYADKAGETVKVDGKGLVLVVAKNVKITGAPEGTKIVVADGATGLTVNGKSVSDDQTYIVPKTTTGSGSSSGGSVHAHDYTIFVTDWSTMTTVKKCSCGATQTVVNSDAYYIANDTDLKAFRDSVNQGQTFAGKTIALTGDVDLKNEEWLPIGVKDGNKFKGTFDGQGNSIKNMKIENGPDYAAFFGAVENAIVKDLTVEGSVSGSNVAGIFGRVDGSSTIVNCINKATVRGTNKAAGIVVKIEANNTTLEGCKNFGNVSCNTNNGAAGIVVYAQTGTFTIKDCVNKGAVEAPRAGGIVYNVSDNGNGTITGCVNKGNITATGEKVAGIVSMNSVDANLTISGCTNEGAISGVDASAIACMDFTHEKGKLNTNSGSITATGTRYISEDSVTLSSDMTSQIDIFVGSTVTISEGSYSGKITNKGTLTVAGGTFTGENFFNEGTLTINNGTFEEVRTNNAGITTINGGTLDGVGTWSQDNQSYTGKLTINGGTIGGLLNLAAGGGTIEVTAGNFTYNDAEQQMIVIPGTASGTITISGGTFAWQTAQRFCMENKNKLILTGGTFSSDPSAYVAEGYKATKDESANTWTVEKMDGYVKIEGLDGWYETLTDAAKAWRESKQVVTSGNTFGANSLGTVDSITWTVSGVVATGDGEGVIGNNGAGQSILGGGYFTPSVTVNSITIKGSNGAKIIKTGDSYLVSAAGQNVVYEDITFVDTVRIDSNPANLTFKNCTFEAGFRMPHSAANGKVTIENCTFTGNESSGYAIFAQGSMASFKVTNSTISNCQRGINVQAGNTAEVTISGNTIENLTGKTENEFTYGSAIQLTSAKTFSVTGNTISDVAVNAFHIYSGCPAVSIEIKDNNISAAYLCWNEANYTNVTSSGNTLNISNAGKCVTKTAEIESTFALN